MRSALRVWLAWLCATTVRESGYRTMPVRVVGTTLTKQAADGLAREIIEEHGAKRPTSLRHDAAEAILVGYWAVEREA